MQEKVIDWYWWRYSVDSDGNIYTNSYWVKRKLKLLTHKNWYLFVNLSKNWKYKSISFHRIVASAFVPNYNNLPQVNHINWNKKDNRVCNLERISIKWNVVHSFKMWLNKPHRRFSEEECINIRNLYKWWMRVCDLCRKFNISKVCMINLLKWISYSDVPL